MIYDDDEKDWDQLDDVPWWGVVFVVLVAVWVAARGVWRRMADIAFAGKGGR